MTADQLAKIHADAMNVPAAWSAQDFAELLDSTGVFVVPAADAGFALGRVIQDEAELLTLAVRPNQQRHGHGRACLEGFESTARNLGATLAHLEVAATNLAAQNLYSRHGWHKTGLRRGYFRSTTGRIDAILMQKRLVPA